MQELGGVEDRRSTLRANREGLVPLAALALVTAAYVFRYGIEDLRFLPSTIFLFSVFVYLLAFLYRTSFVYQAKNFLVSGSVLAVLLGAFMIGSARVLYNVTAEEFISDDSLWMVYVTGRTLVWLGTLVFAPACCLLFLQGELAPDSSNRLISLARTKTSVSLLCALFLGVILYGFYGHTKDALWSSSLTLTLNNIIVGLVNPSFEWLNFFGVIFNLFVNLTSLLPAAVLCAYLLVTVLISNVKVFDLVMASSFLLAGLDPWGIIEMPNPDTIRTSLVLGHAVNTVVIVLVVWLLVHLRNRDRFRFLWPSSHPSGEIEPSDITTRSD
jgi:hypothetical protein